MNTRIPLLTIQDKINYYFDNDKLLTQAFTRKSYTMEHGGENNEVLEFIGDKVLGLCATRFLVDAFGSMNRKRQFTSQYPEGTLTNYMQAMVSKPALSNRIKEMGLNQYLIMGAGDVVGHVELESSVMEDLFEAIIGAIAIDSNWNMLYIQEVVRHMLQPEELLTKADEINPVREIYRLIDSREIQNPQFVYTQPEVPEDWRQAIKNTLDYLSGNEEEEEWKKTIMESVEPPRNDDERYECTLKSSNYPVFLAKGRNKAEARDKVCQMAYDYICEHGEKGSIIDEIENPNINDAINQLETLARRGYFSIPFYCFEQENDQDGNPIWKAICVIDEVEYDFYGYASSKKMAKKEAAFGMLMHVLDEEIDEY